MDMPQIPEEIFWMARTLVDIDRQWIPDKYGMSLYIRPVMFDRKSPLNHPTNFSIVTRCAQLLQQTAFSQNRR